MSYHTYWIGRDFGAYTSSAFFHNSAPGGPLKGVDHVVGEYGYDWYICEEFDSLEDAIDAVRAARKLAPGFRMMSIYSQSYDDGAIHKAWSERQGHLPYAASYVSTQPQEDKTRMEYEDKKPLHVPREALISKLQENLDAEQAKRAEAEAAIAKTRQDAIDAVAQFNGDELVNLLVHCGYSVSDMAEMVKEAKESKRFVSPEGKPSVKESELEKYVRVLTLATDKEIEITPDTEIYRLL